MIVCGVDEAGRGPLAGPVYAAAVILDPHRPIEGLKDSKLLSEKRRVFLEKEIRLHALACAVAIATVEEIDRLNILQASLLAMKRAVEALKVVPDVAWIDGNRCPKLSCRARAIVKGDQLHAVISAASILAKTARDAEMLALHQRYPLYG
jgi:ribonuclease HII